MLDMIEKDHRKLSEMAGEMWRDMTTEERRPWFAASEAEKVAHDEKYPDYKFTPVARERKKRRTKRNGKAETEKVQVLARMIREERPEEEIIATAMLHDYYIASLESGDECEARAFHRHFQDHRDRKDDQSREDRPFREVARGPDERFAQYG